MPKGSRNLLVPGLANIDHIYSVRASLPEIRFHVNLHVLRAYMTLGAKQLLDILSSRIEDGREV